MYMRLVTMSLRLYTWLLHLYPKPFRDAYAGELLQIYKDCCHEIEGQRSIAAVFRLWIWVFPDIILNAGLERLKQISHRQWWVVVQTVGGLAGVLVSGAVFGWTIMAIAIIMLIPWEVGIPPAGTFAESVNNFIDHTDFYVVWAAVILLCELVAFGKVLLSQQYRLSAVCWRFTGLNLAATMICGLLAQAGTAAAQAIFPNIITWEGDQSYAVALVYGGLTILGCLTVFIVRLAWVTPSRSAIKRHADLQAGAE